MSMMPGIRSETVAAALPAPGLSLPDVQQALRLLRALQARPHWQPLPHDPRPVVLYGAGELGQLARAWCRDQGVAVQAVVDASAPRWQDHPAWQGLPVLAPSEVPPAWHCRHRLLLCISTLPWQPLYDSLRGQGWAQVQPFYDYAWAFPDAHPMDNGWHARLPAAGRDAPLRRVLCAWADDSSRAHHLQFLAWRCKRLEWRFAAAPVVPEERYLEPTFSAAWRPGERVLDGGAHHGQTLQRWMDAHPGCIERAWAVEPDETNAATLRGWHRGLPAEWQARVSLHRLALGRRRARLPFIDAQGYASRLWAPARQRVDVQSLDQLGWTPSVVKLHLEGHELPTLQGGAATLARHRPLVALTVYHQRDGLWATADWLMQHLPDYHWRFRLHGWQGTAAVIYGVPAERSSAAH